MDGVFLGTIIKTPLKTMFGGIINISKGWKVAQIQTFIEEPDDYTGAIFVQHEANEAFKHSDWDISSRYAGFIKTFAVTLFYLPIMPYCVFYTIIALAFQYLTEGVRLKI